MHPKKLARRAFLNVMGRGGIGALAGMNGLTRLKGAVPETAIEVGLSKQLLVDDAVIAEKVNLTRRPGGVTKAGPVLKPTLESDHGGFFGFYHTALYNPSESKFQMWYSVGVRMKAENPYRGVGYAESNDGIHWTKPLLSADSKSNIILPMSGNSVLLDPTLPWGHEEKFKAAWMHPQSRVALAYSSDGRRWNFYNDGNPVSHRAGDTQNQIFWDPDRKAYILGTRTDLGPGGGPTEHRGWRFMVHDKGGDIRNHPTAWRTILDRIAVNDPRQAQGSVVPDLQFHHIGMWRHEGIWFQLFNIWTAPRQQEYDENDDQNRHDRDVSDYYLGASRDVVAIDRSFVHNRWPLIPRGAGGTWDDDIVVPSNNIVTRGDEHWIYYCGVNERIFNFKNHDRSYVGLAKLPLDRFIGLEASQASTFSSRREPAKLNGLVTAVPNDSADGLHWTPYHDGKPVTGRAADFTNCLIWDADARTYRLFTRTDYGTPGGTGEIRGMRSMTNPDVKAHPADWSLVRNWLFDREGKEEHRHRQPRCVHKTAEAVEGPSCIFGTPLMLGVNETTILPKVSRNQLVCKASALLLAGTLLITGGAASGAEVEIISTSSGVRFGIWPKRPSKPAPTLFVLSGSVEDALNSAYFRQAGEFLVKEDWLLVSVDLPCHGQETRPKESSGLSGWRERVDHGEDLISDVVGRLKKVLDDLIAEKMADPERIAALGTSRGGFVAVHFAAADVRIKCAAGFAPVTDLAILSEFRGAEQNPLVQRLALERQVDALSGRALWVVIGDRDARVSTDSAIRFARRVTAVSLEKKLPALVDFHVISEPKGHTVPAGWPERAADWFRKQLPERR